MGAQTAVAGGWCWVDERRGQGRGPRRRVREVGALGVIRGEVAGWGKEHIRDGNSGQPSAIDERLGSDCCGRRIRRRCRDRVPSCPRCTRRRLLQPRHSSPIRRLAASSLELAFQLRHEGMRINNASRGRDEDARVSADGGLAASSLGSGEEMGRDANGVSEGVDFVQLGELGGGLGDDPFAAVGVGDVMACAEGVEEGFARKAEAGFERGGAVVEACVDDLTGREVSLEGG